VAVEEVGSERSTIVLGATPNSLRIQVVVILANQIPDTTFSKFQIKIHTTTLHIDLLIIFI
jgi:hypothetical protein